MELVFIEKQCEIKRVIFPNDKMNPDWNVYNRIQDLIEVYGKEEIILYCTFDNSFEKPLEMLIVHIDNLILTYGQELVEKNLCNSIGNVIINRKVG